METAWRLRMQGRTVVQIATQTGFSQKQISKALADYRAVNPPPDLAEHTALELDRLDLQRQRLEVLLDQAMMAAETVITDDGFTAIRNPNLDLARKLVMDLAKLGERQTKFVGADAPEKREVAVTVQSQEERAMKTLFDRIQEQQG